MTNKSSLMAQIDHLKNQLDETRCNVLIHKARANPDDTTHR